jgi:uncharacterized protein
MKSKAKPMVNLTSRSVVCEHAVIADRPLTRVRGLLGRHALPAGEGLLLQPAGSVHTAFMRFPIDVVFLDRNLQVVKVVEHLRPWRTAAARHAKSTLELAAGETAARGVCVGDRLGLVTLAGDASVVQLASGPTNLSAAVPGRDNHNGRGRDHEPLKVFGGVADPIDVLLVSKDRRFRSVTAALLARRGCTVTIAERITSGSELAKPGNTEVVVIDGASSLREAAREAAKVRTLDPPVGVVLVGEDREEGASATPVLPKWGSFDQLYAAIENARPNSTRRSSSGRS